MTRPLRITLVEFAPSGGLYQFALLFGEALAKLGHEVELITGPEPELPSRVPGFAVRPILPTWHPDGAMPGLTALRKARRATRAVRYVVAWRRLRAHIRRTHPDVVQLADLRFAIDGRYITAIGGEPRPPILVDVAHTPRPLAEQSRTGSLHKSGPFIRRWLGDGYARLDAVLVLGERSRQELVDAWPRLRRVEVIPFGSYDVFTGATVPSPGACGPRVLFFGTWTRYKGIDVLLEAFGHLRSRMPEAELVLAGAVGADMDLAAVTAQARAIGGITLEPGYVAAGDVPSLMGAARVVVVPYVAANQSAVVHVAHSFGRPVVASDVGDLADVVADGKTGVMVPARDPQALARALERLLRDPDEAARLGEAGREQLERDASWDAIAVQVADLYEQLTATRDG